VCGVGDDPMAAGGRIDDGRGYLGRCVVLAVDVGLVYQIFDLT
jgi:hypothetical protein